MTVVTAAPAGREHPSLVSIFGHQGHLSAAIGPISDMETPLDEARSAALALSYAGETLDDDAAAIVCFLARQIIDRIDRLVALRSEAWKANTLPLEA